MKTLLAIALLAVLAAVTLGQDSYRVKLTGSYSQLQVAEDQSVQDQGFRRQRTQLNGGVGAGEIRFADILGLHVSAVAEVGAYYGRVTRSSPILGLPFAADVAASDPVRLYSFLAGPQIGHTFGNGKVTVFGRGLVGAARLSGIRGQVVSHDFSAAVGGGIDLNPSKHLVVRPITVDYFVTGFEPGTQFKQSNFGPSRQDALRLGMGLGWRF